ncbi:MAG: class I SAM-dependent methyltransferase [Promethearchaeota archaeon]
MKTYTHSSLVNYIQLFKNKFNFSKYNAKTAFHRFLNIKKKINNEFGFILTDKKILDIGCGQRYPYTYLFSNDNDVIGIDTDVPLLKHDIKTYLSIISNNGFNRFLKTFLRSIFLDKAYFKELSRLGRVSKKINFKIIPMNAEELNFKNDSFDFVLSILSFEHFKNVEKCVEEMKRVLKVGGKFYVSIDLFSKLRGGHEINPSRPWNHLLTKNFKSSVYLNKHRLNYFKKVFTSHFQTVKFTITENLVARSLLTPEIRNALSDYSETELVMNPLIVIGEK